MQCCSFLGWIFFFFLQQLPQSHPACETWLRATVCWSIKSAFWGPTAVEMRWNMTDACYGWVRAAAKSLTKRQICVWCTSCKQALGVTSWSSSTISSALILECQKEAKCAYGVFVLLEHLCDCDWHAQQADDIHTENNLSNSTLPEVRKEFRELRNFCVRAASQASQLLKIHRTIKQPRRVHVCVKLVRSPLRSDCMLSRVL